jgi:hypothetical protein
MNMPNCSFSILTDLNLQVDIRVADIWIVAQSNDKVRWLLKIQRKKIVTSCSWAYSAHFSSNPLGQTEKPHRLKSPNSWLPGRDSNTSLESHYRVYLLRAGLMDTVKEHLRS